MLINNIRQLQTITESGADEIAIINEILANLKLQLKIDAAISDIKGISIYNKKLNPNEFFYKIPLTAAHTRYGMLYVNGIDNLTQNELAYFYAAIPLLSLALRHIYLKIDEKKKRFIAGAKIVIGSMTCLEIDALKLVFKEISSDKSIIVISKISRESGITRSLIVNALKKIESAGIIDTSSLGMKGTKISVLNKYFISELENW